MSPYLHHRTNLKKTLSELGVDSRLGYDLLAVPSISYAGRDEARLEILLGNVALAIDVHKAEQVIVMTGAGGDNNNFLDRLLKKKESSFPELEVRGVMVSSSRVKAAAKPAKRLMVTCMDFRLHRDKSLHDMFPEPAAWLTYPGAAHAALDEATVNVFIEDMLCAKAVEEIEEIVVVSHTDCAKYRAEHVWNASDAELRILSGDLRTACAQIRSRLNGVKVRAAIAVIKGGRAVDLVSVA